MGDFNQSVILDSIRRARTGLSRVELAAATGLSAQTISNICRRLLQRGLIEEAGKEISGPGKPRTMLRLNPTGRFTLGVHLDPTVTTYVMLDLTGAIVARSRRPTPTSSDPGVVIASLVSELDALIAISGVSRERIAGIGVAAPGPIDTVNGIVVNPPHLAGWRDVPLREALAEGTGLPVILDKDVTAAAIAEMWVGGPSGTGSFIFFYMGTGIGAGLVVDDDVIRGSSDNAGEIGHIVTDPDGPECFCGLRGCVLVACMPQALVREAEEAGIFPADPRGLAHDTVDARFTELCEASAAGDAVARGILDRSAVRMTTAIAVIANILDVDHVVFGGPFWERLAEHYMRSVPALLGERLAARSVHGVAVMGTGIGEDVAAVGAACLVLNQGLAPNPRALMLA
ncbi:ROK family transcriptional regulator [uncultured Schumannella sp.]|uniref:ROK family transcriptional regulator n=1 Tax=uncultured Schumannella sp. TaxID=1195956 RepID=UPI0025DF7138|nr:ROK family transcriptional regulator [uncultured Schumannella sp.]